MIPKLIFQTWKTNEVPDIWKEAQTSVIKQNNNWKYRLLTDEDNLQMVKQYFPDFLPYYIGFKYPIQRADAIRYIILYLYGGIYIDLDYEVIKPFDTIALSPGKEVGLLESNNKKNIVTNSFMISQPKSKFWLECIEEMKKPKPLWAITKHLEIFTTTGPFMLHRVYKRNINIAEMLHSISVPCNICEISTCARNDKYYIMPIQGGSWHSYDTWIMNFIYCNKYFLISLLILILLVIFCIKKMN